MTAPTTADLAQPRTPMSRLAATREVARLLPPAHAFRVTNTEDATTIDSACTGSVGECMYWFRVEIKHGNSWNFWRFFALDSMSRQLFSSSNRNLEEARRGDYRPVDAAPP